MACIGSRMHGRPGLVVVVEGESDTHTLWNAGFPALGLPGAGNWKEQRDAALVLDIANGFHSDRTRPGRRHRLEVARSLVDRAASAAGAVAKREGPQRTLSCRHGKF